MHLHTCLAPASIDLPITYFLTSSSPRHIILAVTVGVRWRYRKILLASPRRCRFSQRLGKD